jgi:hypothetical protein
MPQVFGFVRAILSRDPRHTAAPIVVEIYSPKETPGARTKRFDLSSVCENRELVLVSILRDALVHSLPIELGCDDEGRIDHVEIRTRAFYEEWEEATITGKVEMISVDEFGVGNGNFLNPNIATVSVRTQRKSEKLHLNLQRAEKETKIAQLSLLESAYHSGSDVTIKYHIYPIGGGKTAKVIIGVQLGQLIEIITSPLTP